MLHIENAYKVPKVDVRGYCCNTNIQSNTAFRGFGGPQGNFVAETYMDEIACEIGMDPAELRERNLYQEGDVTFYSQKLDHLTLKRCWDECKAMSNYDQVKQEVKQWNQQHKWKKRGITLIPCKYGVAFGGVHMNQGGALVQVRCHHLFYNTFLIYQTIK